MALDANPNMPCLIAYCDTGSEHPDNKRFLKECETWFGREIQVFKSKKYQDIWDVFAKTRYLVGPKGARCTTELKKVLRYEIENLETDLQVFGFDATEQDRVTRFKQNNPEVRLFTPLLDNNISKDNCLKILSDVGIAVPKMYELGYRNNNCIGCVKGGIGYWNKIREDFPEVFERMSAMEQTLGIAILKYKGKRVMLKDIPENAGHKQIGFEIKCGLVCGDA